MFNGERKNFNLFGQNMNRNIVSIVKNPIVAKSIPRKAVSYVFVLTVGIVRVIKMPI